jgi:mRNA interferase RelE/StbE
LTKSDAPKKYKYRLKFVPSALKEWNALDGSLKEPLQQLLRKRLNNPHVPGGALHGPLIGCYKIKLRKHGIRLVYSVEDDALVVMVLSVDKREDSVAYKSATSRIAQKANLMATGLKRKAVKQTLS